MQNILSRLQLVNCKTRTRTVFPVPSWTSSEKNPAMLRVCQCWTTDVMREGPGLQPRAETSTLRQRKGRAPQPSIMFSCQARGVGGGGGGGGGGGSSMTTTTRTWFHQADLTNSRARPKNKTETSFLDFLQMPFDSRPLFFARCIKWQSKSSHFPWQKETFWFPVSWNTKQIGQWSVL